MKFLSKISINKKNISLLIIGLVIIITLAFIVHKDKNNTNPSPQESSSKQVKTITIGDKSNFKNKIEAVGTVKPETSVDIVSLGKGTVKNINFKVGDEVALNQTLVSLYDVNTLTNLNNSNTVFSNLKNNLETTKKSADQNILQGEIAVKNAGEAIKAAEIAYETSKDNLNNGISLQEKSVNDLKNNSINSYNSNLNTVHNALNDIDFILKVDGDSQIAGIKNTLGAKNLQSVNQAIQSYKKAKNYYNELSKTAPTPDSSEQDTSNIISLLKLVKISIDDTINVLDNTVTSSSFPVDQLNAQKASFSALRLSIINNQTQAESTLQALQNIELTNKQARESLENSVESSKNRLDQSKLAYENSLASLNSLAITKDQLILNSQTSLDNSKGQLDIARTQALNLTIKSPISGTISKKLIEIGSEINIGQKIAEVSKLGIMKIELNLGSEDAGKIKRGQKAFINGRLEGKVSLIEPAADPITKKIKVEVIYDNSNSDLIAETFAKIEIPFEKIIDLSKDGIFVPLSAVTISQTENYVFLYNNGSAKKTLIELGKTEGKYIEIKSGIKEGDILVLEGSKLLEDGDKLEIIE